MTSETTRTKIVEGVLWKMRGSIEKFVSSSRSGVMEGSKAQSWVKVGSFGSDDDCGNGGALINHPVNDLRHRQNLTSTCPWSTHLLRYNAYGLQRHPTVEKSQHPTVGSPTFHGWTAIISKTRDIL
jgi:hypothetical protein